MGNNARALLHERGRWRLLFHCRHETVARARTTTGHPINVSLCLAAPPQESRVCVQLPAGVEVTDGSVVAAHGDSVVVQVWMRIRNPRVSFFFTESIDHFIYSAGDAAAEPPRPPSLSLLPPRSFTYEEQQRRPGCNLLNSATTGLLCRGDGEFLLAELKMDYERYPQSQGNNVRMDLFRCGSGEWCVKRPVISRYADGSECVDLPSSWKSNLVIAVGDQMLCWVDLYKARGLLFSGDVFDESPSLRYVPLPEPSNQHLGCRNVCVTADGSMIKFVIVIPRCCCGGVGISNRRASHHAYTVRTWTLRMDDMTWAMGGSLDATQLWALDGYRGLPRVELDDPVVSMDEADAISFVVCEKRHEGHGDETMWRIMVDMKSKTLRSVVCRPQGWRNCSWGRHLSSRISGYFNSKPSCGQQPPGPPSAQAEAILNLINTRIMQAASSAILAAVQEIPGLDRDDMMKAYRILAHDDSGRRFRALMGLPMDLRKDCVLMEIKASEACVLCSACSADWQCK